MIENEIPKHRKKKQSSTSKSSTKSKHKHEYKECLLIHNGHPHRATYCEICGKIDNLFLFESEKVEGKSYSRILDDDEIYEKYKNLEKYCIEDTWQKYVPIKENIQNR